MRHTKSLPFALLAICCICSCTTVPTKTQAKWRYGIYSEDQRNVPARFRWETSHSAISCATRAAIARELGYNIADKAESPENNLTLLTLFDQLGDRGWQLTHIEDAIGGTTRRYFFRRQTEN